MIDIGVNLTNSAFSSRIPDVITNAKSAGVNALIVTGTSINESMSAYTYTKQFPKYLYSTAGIHPHHAAEFRDDSIEQIRTLLGFNEVVALGECGLDYNRNYSTKIEQLKCFEAQLELASEINCPLFLHQRDAHDDFLRLIKKYRDSIEHIVVHCFTDGENELKDYVDLSLYVGITGWICDERRGAHLKEIVQLVPLDHLMIETDAPYLLPRDLVPKPKSRINEPKYLPHICQTIAKSLQLPAADLAKITEKNTNRFFGL